MTYLDKVLSTLKRKWQSNCKKDLGFDETIDLTFSDMNSFYLKHELNIISKYAFQLVYENTTFKDKQKLQQQIAETEFKQTIKNIFKNGLEKCIDIDLILDLIEIAITTKFIFLSELEQNSVKGFQISSI